MKIWCLKTDCIKKKKAFYEQKLSETIGKPKELWESLKSLDMANKTAISSFNAIEENDVLTYDTRSISKIFKYFLSDITKSLLIKLPNSPHKYNLHSVIRYYSSFMISDDFCLSNTYEEKVLKIMTNIESSKAAGVDERSGRFLKDGAVSSSHRESPQMLVKLQNWSLFLKSGRKLILLTKEQFHCFCQFRRSLEG